MPKKQVTTTSKTAAAPAPARNAKPGTPRVSTAKHSKAISQETAAVAVPVAEDPHTAISKIAYGYWAARGFRDGSPHEDWIRAEREYLTGK